MNLAIYTPSRSQYDLCMSLEHKTERRLEINLAIMSAAYEKSDIPDIIWIKEGSNPADDLIKGEQRSGILSVVVDKNHFSPKLESCIQRYTSEMRTTANSRY